MDLNHNRGKIIAASVAGVALTAVLAGSLLALAGRGPASRPAEAAAGGGNPAQPPPARLLADCDRLAATPGDPNRAAAVVEDDAVAPLAAIAACEAAVAANPDSARAQFQLARVYAIAGRRAEAFAYYVQAAKGGYGAALKAIGDAFRDGVGLPPGEVQNLPTAIAWYRKAVQAGFPPAEEALRDAETVLARNTFDPSLFQNADYMKRLYEGDFSNLQYPVGFAYYLKGVGAGLDGSEVIFIDPACRPLVSKIGSDALELAPPLLFILTSLQSQSPDGSWSADALGRNLQSYVSSAYIEDMGRRDASVLFNKDGRYGCDSIVTQRIVSNFMLVIRNG